MHSETEKKKILFLAANPEGTVRLRLDKEFREISERLQLSKKRDQFSLEQRVAVRVKDIRVAMLSGQPHIVHFSGHGAGEEGLVFEDENEQSQLVNAAALAGFFKLFADQVECVVLNGCYSEVQATAIAQHINYVIGMNKEIVDRAAIEFAVGFYDALGAGSSIEFAYQVGCNALEMREIKEHPMPVLLKKSQITGTVAYNNSTGQQLPTIMEFPTPQNQAIEVFFSYAHEDEALRNELTKHLKLLERQKIIKAWYDRDISAGNEWRSEIEKQLNAAQIILLLVSPDFMASDFCWSVELERAMERHEAAEARVIPIILREVNWHEAPFGKLQALPKNAQPVTNWSNRDQAFADIAREISKVVKEELNRNFQE